MAGTINTTNYNFKKYAPDDTVSVLQTFNGNMDLIDAAIKARENEIATENATIQKHESAISNLNDGLNSTNSTLSALQVAVTTNTRNIQSQQTELDSQDARIQALEDGGSAVTKVNTNFGKQPATSYVALWVQGTHYFGNVYENFATATNANDLIAITSADNIAIPTSINLCKQLVLTGNPFGLNPNIGHCIGTASIYATVNSVQSGLIYPCMAVFDGTSTYIGSIGNTVYTNSSYILNVDFIVGQ